nr:MAG TPA: hypothetical protein [Caudoviricetes sp.]
MEEKGWETGLFPLSVPERVISFVSIYLPHRRGLIPQKTVMYVLQGAQKPLQNKEKPEGQDHDKP